MSGALPSVAATEGTAKLQSKQPWSEKYRPQSLDEVAAHTDIIDTSKSTNHLFTFYSIAHNNSIAFFQAPSSTTDCNPTQFLFLNAYISSFSSPLLHFSIHSQKARSRKPAPPSSILWPSRYRQNLHHPGPSQGNVRQISPQYELGTQCF
jgi:hypothetical protein